MKIVVNGGRTVHVAVKSGSKKKDEDPIRPVVKAYGPRSIVEVSDDDAAHLIKHGFASKYEPPKPVEQDPPPPAE